MKSILSMRRCLCLLLALALLVPAAAAEAGEELLNNGDFSQALNWRLYTESGGAATLSIADGELAVDVSAIGGVGHAIQPYYDGFKLTQGVSYRLCYDVRATVPRELYVRIQLNGGDYHAYFEELVRVTEETQHRETVFTMEEASDPAPRLCVNMGYTDTMQAGGVDPASLAGHRVTFDNFSLTVEDAAGAVAQRKDPAAAGIRVNQVGYRPDAVKTAVFASLTEDSDTFRVVNARTGETVYEGALTAPADDPWAGERNRRADFTALIKPGTYCLESADGTRSPEFTVGDDVYAELFRSVVRMLYLQRCGTALDGNHAGAYAHPACHTEPAVVYGTDVRIDVGGGWHDAGDYGRYVVSGAKAAADLLLAAEARGAITDDAGTPESGDGLDDLIQEARYELDWMLKMQDASGGVYHKVTCRNFPAFVMPEQETDELVVCPISNTATGDFAGVMALAGRVMAKDWPEDAARYVEAAERAWAYLEAHRGDPGFVNPEGIVTGEYGDDSDSDEVFWASAELARTTGKGVYRRTARELLPIGGKQGGLGWVNMGAYGLLAIVNDEGLATDDGLRQDALAELRAMAEVTVARIQANPYGADREGNYEWGSNMGIANTGSMLALAADPLGDASLRTMAQQSLDYLLGRNATDYCFVTGVGTRFPQHPHHRPSVAQGAAMPGMLVGGPDSGLDDPYARSALAGAAPAKCYADSNQSYSTNEACVYWNSPLALLLAAMG